MINPSRLRHCSFPIFLVFHAFTSAAAKEGEGLKLFRESLEPVLKRNCFECHSHESGKSKGGLMVDSAPAMISGGNSGAIIVPGNPEKSLLYRAVAWLEEDTEMPPKKKLSEAEIGHFRKWISLGAPDPRISEPKPRTPPSQLWSLKPVKSPPPPLFPDSSWPRNQVDQFILAKLNEASLPPLGDASARTLIRRLYLDLTGLPPAPEAFERWLPRFGDSPHNSATTELADELMSTPQFGERWARHWLDTARYAESDGNNRNRVFRYAKRYRNWVINSHNGDKAYDQFLGEQLAGDLIKEGNTRERANRRIATGFLAIGSKPYFPTIVPIDPKEPDRARFDWAAEQIDITMTGMKG